MALYLKKNLHALYQRMLYTKFGWNWPCSSQVEIFKNILHIFSLLCYYLPLRKGVHGPLFVKIWIPSTQGCFVPNLVEIVPIVLKRGFLNIFQYNFTISLLSPLWKRRGPSFEQSWISSTQGCFVVSLVEIDRVVLKIFKYF